MPFIAIIGAGALGGAVAHALARRERVDEVRLIDPSGSIAAGKALDILQSSPIEGFSTRVTSAESIGAAVGARVIVVADRASDNAEYAGEPGLAACGRTPSRSTRRADRLRRRCQRELMAAPSPSCAWPTRIVGSAPFALESALRALAGLALDGTGVEVALRVVGVPPRAAVVGWEEGRSADSRCRRTFPRTDSRPHARIPGLWPPGPFALGAACARVVEALDAGSRRTLLVFRRDRCGPGERRGGIDAAPVSAREGGARARAALTRLERTRLENALDRIARTRPRAAGAAAGAERGVGAPRATAMGGPAGRSPRPIDRLAGVEHHTAREVGKVLAKNQAAAVQPRLQRLRLHPQHRAGFLGRKSLDVAQNHRHPIDRRQLLAHPPGASAFHPHT